jgi:hypothetical protein
MEGVLRFEVRLQMFSTSFIRNNVYVIGPALYCR